MSLSPKLTEQLKHILREETYKGEAGTVNAHQCDDCFQTSLTHYVAGSEDILITENSPIFRMLLLASLLVEISGQDTICYQKISFHQICPH